MKKILRYGEVTVAHIVYVALFVLVILWIFIGHMH
jgi:hypothetical protein